MKDYLNIIIKLYDFILHYYEWIGVISDNYMCFLLDENDFYENHYFFNNKEIILTKLGKPEYNIYLDFMSFKKYNLNYYSDSIL